MSIKSFTPSNIDAVQHDIEAAIQAVCKKHGVTAKFGNISYSSATYSSKMEIYATANGDADKIEFNRYAMRFGLKNEAYGSTFTVNGETFTVVAIKPKAKQYPIIGQNSSGKRYKFDTSVIDQQYRYG